MAKKLTDIGIHHLKPAASRREIPDGGCAGLYLIVQPNDKRSWAVRYRHDGRTRKLTLGSPPPIGLAQARKLAAEALLEVGHGIDPAATKQDNKRAAKQAAAKRAEDTVERLVALFLAYTQKRLRPATQRQAQSILYREVLPQWRGRLASTIGRKDVKELIRAIADTRPVLANRTQAYLSKFFKWLANEDYIAASPAVGIERPGRETSRERALSDDELRRLWAALGQLPVPMGEVYRLLLLTGARRQEVADMRWCELDPHQQLWTLPAARSKNKKPVAFPLGPTAWEIIANQPRVSEYVFGRPCNGFIESSKKKLDATLRFNEPWRTHDLRRTVRSLLARARVPDNVAELMLGHLLMGMARVYNVHSYLAEKRDGFEALEREIDLIINPPSGDVIAFRR
jgi:integrase